LRCGDPADTVRELTDESKSGFFGGGMFDEV
jgi:hypothetical protein